MLFLCYYYYFLKSLSFVRFVQDDYKFLLWNVLTVYIKFILCQMFCFK